MSFNEAQHFTYTTVPTSYHDIQSLSVYFRGVTGGYPLPLEKNVYPPKKGMTLLHKLYIVMRFLKHTHLKIYDTPFPRGTEGLK